MTQESLPKRDKYLVDMRVKGFLQALRENRRIDERQREIASGLLLEMELAEAESLPKPEERTR